jgi:hypothetical protein
VGDHRDRRLTSTRPQIGGGECVGLGPAPEDDGHRYMIALALAMRLETAVPASPSTRCCIACRERFETAHPRAAVMKPQPQSGIEPARGQVHRLTDRAPRGGTTWSMADHARSRSESIDPGGESRRSAEALTALASPA